MNIDGWDSDNEGYTHVKKQSQIHRKNFMKSKDFLLNWEIMIRGFLYPHEMSIQVRLANFKGIEDTEVDGEDSITENEISLLQMMIIPERSTFSTVFKATEIVFSILSSFFYTFLSGFSSHDMWGKVVIIEGLTEFFFGLCMVKKFFTEYTPEGQQAPVKNFV